jgi:stage II sporulation protein E
MVYNVVKTKNSSKLLSEFCKAKQVNIILETEIKMQNGENVKNKEIKDGNRSFFARMLDGLKEKDEREVRARLRALVRFAFSVTAAYFVGAAELFFGAYPLCLALGFSSRRDLAPVTLGILILFFTGGLPPIYAFAYVAAILIRMLAALLPSALSEIGAKVDAEGKALVRSDGSKITPAEKKRLGEGEIRGINKLSAVFCEPLHIKLLAAAASGLLCGIFLLIRDDFSFYSLCATLTLTALCPISVLFLGGHFGDSQYKRDWYIAISSVFIAAITVYASGDRSIIGMPMAPFLAMLITLYMTSGRGMITGGVAAIACGLIFDVLYMPLLVISAILFCLISAVKKNMGLATVCALVVIWCYYIGGTSGLVGVLPPMLLAIPVYMIADKYREMMYAPYDRAAVLAGGVYFAEAVTEKSKNEDVRERLCALSDAFASLSETFYKLSDRHRRPDMLGLKRLTEAAFEKHCGGCRNRELCWGAQYSDTLVAQRDISEGLHKSGAVSADELSADFRMRCFRLDAIIGEVNSAVTQTTENLIKGEKAGFFASNYDDITSILKDALSSDGDEYESNMEMGEAIFRYLYDQGLKVSGVVVYGKRCLRVAIKGVGLVEDMGGKRETEICQNIARIVETDLTEPTFEVGRDGVMMLLRSKPKFRARCSHGYVAASAKVDAEGEVLSDELYVDPFSDGDELCGDVTNAFITDSSYFYSLISDGMGSGAEAAFTSGVCSMFIEKMLGAGNRADITLRMLNNIIRSENMGCGGECSATVDLCELDLISGTAQFIKSGAAPTYIARGETVYKINSRTMPVGIIKDADARITRFQMQRGDIIIMMSDGCCPDSDDCAWLVEFLCGYTASRKRALDVERDECDELKDKLLSLAVKNFPPDRERDDISVSVITVE